MVWYECIVGYECDYYISIYAFPMEIFLGAQYQNLVLGVNDLSYDTEQICQKMEKTGKTILVTWTQQLEVEFFHKFEVFRYDQKLKNSSYHAF